VIDIFQYLGLVVNKEKTEMCVSNKKDVTPVAIKIRSDKDKNQISVLGVIFYSRLKWSIQLSHIIQKANKALCAITLISRYFSTKELVLLLTSNYSAPGRFLHLPGRLLCIITIFMSELCSRT
jgi:hypothetical protein